MRERRLIPVEFTSRYADLSSDNGFQWEFDCGRCWTAYRSTFQQNYLSRGRGVLRSLGELVGGGVQSLSSAAEDFSGSWGDTASATRDRAFRAAIDEVRGSFRHCPGCGTWVCLTCFNPQVGQCQDCSPAVEQEVARVQAEARRGQLREEAARQDLTGELDLATPACVVCGCCGSRTTAGRFCGSCGSALDTRAPCGGCGRLVEAGATFCAHCGARQ